MKYLKRWSTWFALGLGAIATVALAQTATRFPRVSVISNSPACLLITAQDFVVSDEHTSAWCQENDNLVLRAVKDDGTMSNIGATFSRLNDSWGQIQFASQVQGVTFAASTVSGTGTILFRTQNVTRLSINSTGSQFSTGIRQGSGMKHQRASITSLAGGGTTTITLTWTSAFADTSYTPVCNVVTPTAAATGLVLVTLANKLAASVDAFVSNTTGGSLSGELDCIAMHD